MLKHATHIVWDWNGTLFHDIDAVVEASNASCAEVGLAPLTLERYRELYRVPVRGFYEHLLGRSPSDAEWAALNVSFHRHYRRLAASCGLAEGAADLLAARRAAGGTQSLCSLAPHADLVPLVTAHGIAGHFVRMDGASDLTGAAKAAQLARHLDAMDGMDPRRTVVIGDALDDAAAAAHVGARAVLYSGGSHSRASLRSAGVPVVDTLAEAVAVADRVSA
ncbi:HAD family hydrolase [Streptantibioticus silvisoli]|uniref:Haloacid dehalogenase-like hydrolase n=1 Tax=Streptantibioticus silvisoli TaxID=2705255 RepID=A0ABT6W6E6_9ACTN|nr:HAD hydrolase-like protein [Streptantibioticus silvisoli]MDI5965965.1 haloacid dehalogenase-like hydrolase [Streptantibioticus silvisoli]